MLTSLTAAGLIAHDGRRKALLRHLVPTDFYLDVETQQVGAKRFTQWILQGDCKAGQQINGLELSRQFRVSPSAILDYLNRFVRYGLLERGRAAVGSSTGLPSSLPKNSVR
jgi:hypothetical protein